MSVSPASRPVRKIWLILFGLIFGYASAEVIFNLYYLWRPPNTQTFWAYDHLEQSMLFDPVLGYRLTTRPCRLVHFNLGRLEIQGQFVGNSQGFASHFDFGPQRPAPDTERIAVFGDSFSAGLPLAENWPDHLQRLAASRGQPAQIMNFSIDSAGLGNWWSVLTRMVGPQHYDLDAIVFAIYDNDLTRRFCFAGQRTTGPVRMGSMPGWDPATFPKTLAEADRFMRWGHAADSVSSEVFEQALRGEWHPAPRRRLRLWIAQELFRAAKTSFEAYRQRTAPPVDPGAVSFDPGQEKMIQDIHEFARSRHLPVIVLYAPGRDTLLNGPVPRYFAEIEAFARKLEAEFIDGREAFKGLSQQELNDSLAPHDFHWSQKGSDHIADFMARVLADRKDAAGRSLLPPPNPAQP